MQRKAPLHTEPYDSLRGSGEGIPPEHLLFNVEKKQKQTKQPFVSGKAIQRGTLTALMCITLNQQRRSVVKYLFMHCANYCELRYEEC